ncbi:MAG TPA: hypothetical protein VHB21_21590, partial [Minicystis sp.]|nr:hypothetical protein [Minicystis sp.]
MPRRDRAAWIDELAARGERVEYESLDALSEASAAGGGRFDRRRLLSLVGASLALAGLAGCSRERPREILPYTITPRDVTPGVPVWYATSLEIDGYATGVLVESHEGRPTKVEGNP